MGPRPNGRGKRPIRWPPGCALCGVNGAAAKRPRKGPGAARCRRPPLASMGPRPNGRGKARTAAAARPTCSVNGAAAKRPRKAALDTSRMMCSLRQWGRGQTAAERVGAARNVSGRAASMGPRPNGRGKAIFAAAAAAQLLMRQWGRGQTAAERVRLADIRVELGASMGPRPNGRGKLTRNLTKS